MNKSTTSTPPKSSVLPTATACLGFLVTRSALHIGTGEGLGDIDKPVLRDVVTLHPRIQPAALKRGLKDVPWPNLDESQRDALFGAEGGLTGMLGPQDGSLLLMPVPCWAGGIAWVTSPGVLKQFHRHAKWCGINKTMLPSIKPAINEACVFSDVLSVGTGQAARVVLHDLPLNGSHAGAQQSTEWCNYAQWLIESAFAHDDADWHTHVQQRLAVVSDAVFDSLVQRSLATPARNAVEEGLVRNLWREELVPEDAVFHSVITAQAVNQHQKIYPTSAKALVVLQSCDLQIGGQASLGRGFLRLNLLRPGRTDPQGDNSGS